MRVSLIPERDIVEPRQFVMNGVRYQEVTLEEFFFFAENHPMFLTKVNDVWCAPIGIEKES